MACQYSLTRPCEVPAAFRLTFRSRWGFEWIEVQCKTHADPRKDQIRGEGGELIAVEELPQPPADQQVEALRAEARRV